MYEPLISVIVPVYNTAPWLRACLDSICRQTYLNLEIICVNDGSTDGSPEILEEYAMKDHRIKVIHQKNAGLSAARNVGIRAAKGDYVTGVDSDDYLDLEAYAILLPHLQDKPDLVCFGIRGVDQYGNDVSNAYMQLPQVGDFTPETELILKTNAYFWNKLFNLQKVREWGCSFPEGLRHEDAVFVYGYMPQCKKLRYVEDKLYNYMQRDGSITNSARMQLCAFDFCPMLETLFVYYQKHGMLPKWRELYHRLFMAFYEHSMSWLAMPLQRKAMKLYHDMVERTGLHKEYPGMYPYAELHQYHWLRRLFFWRNEKRKVYKILRWVVLTVEETENGMRRKWFGL